MPRVVTAILLQVYALALALLQASQGGLHTDEAKYLLNIPYPQPPLARWILHATESLPFQELLWRVLFATLLIQAVWIVWGMTAKCKKNERLFLSGCWLATAAVALQAGSIMMAPLTALQALLFVKLALFDPPTRSPRHLFAVAILWLVSLFTAVQIILYLPLILAFFYRSRASALQIALYVLGPIALVSLYVATNPFVAVSFGNAGTENLDIPFLGWFGYTLRLMVTGGSLVLTVLGLLGIFTKRRLSLIGSFVLVTAFIFISFREYYDIFFTPLFLAGAILLLSSRRLRLPFVPMFGMLVAVTVGASYFFPMIFSAGPARPVMRAIEERSGTGAILIAGPFGHQWQYESRLFVLRYNEKFLPEAKAAVCLNPCEGIEKSNMEKHEVEGVEVWTR